MKSKAMESFLDQIAELSFGRSRSESMRDAKCVCCGGDATEFSDELSRKEYGISGFCEKCQNGVFNSVGEDN